MPIAVDAQGRRFVPVNGQWVPEEQAQAPAQQPGGIVFGAPKPPPAPTQLQLNDDRRAEERLALARADAARGPAGQDPFNRERQLRTAYGATKPVQSLQTVQPQIALVGEMARNSAAYLRGEPGARQPTAADDMTMVFSFMKMLDPNSVVRETEYQSAANATGIVDRMGNLYNQTLRGNILNPRQRQEFFQAATAAMDAYTNGAAQQSDYYRGLATDYELNPDHVAPAIRRPARRDRPSPPSRTGDSRANVGVGGLGALGGIVRPAGPKRMEDMTDAELQAIASRR